MIITFETMFEMRLIDAVVITAVLLPMSSSVVYYMVWIDKNKMRKSDWRERATAFFHHFSYAIWYE